MDRKAYWKKVRKEALARTRTEFWSGTPRTIAIAVIGFFLACATLSAMHVPIPVALVVGLGSAIVANLIYYWGWRLAVHMFTIPANRDSQLLQTVERRDTEIVALKAPKPDPITTELTYVQFGANPQSSGCNAQVFFVIRNSGPETTLEMPFLMSALYGQIARCTGLQVDGRNLYVGSSTSHVSIEIGERKKKNVAANFNVQSGIDQLRIPENQWRLEIKDIDGHTYSKPLPPATYVDLTTWQAP